MQQQRGVGDLLEGGPEGGHQVRRQVADEAHRVGDDHLALAREAQPARGRVERREHPVGDQHGALGERAQQRALAGVGVADDREDRQLAPRAPAPPRLALPAQRAELALQPRDALAHAPAVDLELLLAGPAPADPAGQARERAVLDLREPRQPVAQLGELDLELAVPGRGVLREDVEDQLGAVDHAQIEPLREVARLRRRQVLVEDDQVDVALEGADHELLEATGADQQLRIDARPVLRDDTGPPRRPPSAPAP